MTLHLTVQRSTETNHDDGGGGTYRNLTTSVASSLLLVLLFTERRPPRDDQISMRLSTIIVRWTRLYIQSVSVSQTSTDGEEGSFNLGNITIIYQFGIFVLRRINFAEWCIWFAWLLRALVALRLLLLLVVCRRFLWQGDSRGCSDGSTAH